ncbi:TolC family protein [Parabacteroides distasonis]|uniref:TolC family protein n=1 Tax=Parabacteroides distasonis TaxID=823 RepID=UPI00189E7B19|nr:TolC family protein [Parabacteroides distasonis]MDB9152655.1 TolC family protein [Parabacteroides distasonis]MDB9157232.1 TolC family protein [Parabacteroides distasonis]MDB9166246.1 TolC family protein [Parabacteroides distasonis]MDB9170665.1 TolC family protein [Parabacteroides distasonis]MDB9193136.1 TolC family protein [Parabacteroides distasonis]
MKYITTLFSLMLLPILAQAQTVTLDECQRLAQENYPLIKQYDLIRQTTDYSVSNISKGWLPQISATAQASYQSDVMTLPDPLQAMLGQQGYAVKGLRKDQYRIGIDLNQTVYDGGLISGQKNVARLEGEVQTAQTTTNLYAIRQRVNDLYFGILLLEEKIRLNKDLQTLLQSNLDKLHSMLSNGIAMQSDVNTVMAEKLKAEQQATELASSRKSLLDMLAVFIGKSITNLTIPQDVMVQTMENNRPELRLFDTQIELANAQERLLNARLLPKLSVFAQGYYGYPGYDMFDAMFNRDWKLNGMIGVRLSWNIGALYTRKNDRAKLNTHRGLVESARETFLFNNHLTEIQQSDGIAKYRQMIKDDQEIVALRSDVRRSAESRLEHGIIDTNNLLQEITRENQSRIDLSTHTILMLKESYDLKYTTNN